MMTTCLDRRSSPTPDCFLPRTFRPCNLHCHNICTMIRSCRICVFNNTDEATLGNFYMLKLLDEDIETIAPVLCECERGIEPDTQSTFLGFVQYSSIFQPMSFIIGIRKLIVGVVQNGQLVTNLRTAKTSYWPAFVLWPLLNLEMYFIAMSRWK